MSPSFNIEHDVSYWDIMNQELEVFSVSLTALSGRSLGTERLLHGIITFELRAVSNLN